MKQYRHKLRPMDLRVPNFQTTAVGQPNINVLQSLDPCHLGCLGGSHLCGNRVACKQVSPGLTFMFWLVFRDEQTLFCKVRWYCKFLQETRNSQITRNITQLRNYIVIQSKKQIHQTQSTSLSIIVHHSPSLSTMNQSKSQVCTCWRGILSLHLVTTDFRPSASCPLAAACGSGFS